MKRKAQNIRESLSILTEVFETAYDAFHDNFDFNDIDDMGRIVSLLYNISKKANNITKECKNLSDKEIDEILAEHSLELKEIFLLIKNERI